MTRENAAPRSMPIRKTAARLGPSPATRIPGYPAIPGYEIVRELGAGGMAVVYEATNSGSIGGSR